MSFSMKNIIATLNQLEQQLAQLNYEELSAIERDIVLEKMRSIYEKVLVAEVVTPEEKKVVLEAPNIVVPIVDVPVEEPIEESVIELIEELIDQVEEFDDTEEEVEEICAPAEELVEEPVEESVIELIEELIDQVEGFNDTEEEDIEVEQVEEELVVEAPAAPKAKIDHKKVLSLYDDDDDEVEPTVEQPAEEELAVEEEPTEEPIEEDIVFEMDMSLDEEEIAPEEEEKTLIEEVADKWLANILQADEQELEEEHVEEPVAPAVEEARTVVLADVLGGEQQTIADTMAATQSPDVATIAAATTTSLMKSVSINDKILLTRDLFAGNGALYEQAMEVLDSYESLDEAMLFIYDNFDWNPNSEGAKLLVDLLMRKLL